MQTQQVTDSKSADLDRVVWVDAAMRHAAEILDRADGQCPEGFEVSKIALHIDRSLCGTMELWGCSQASVELSRQAREL